MKTKNRALFFVGVIVIFLCAFVFTKGVTIGDYRINSLGSALKLGLDLRGGVTIEEEIADKTKLDTDTLNRTKQLLEMRVNGLGVTESTVTVTANKRIRIEIPGIYDAQKALEQVGKTGKLRFVGPNNDEILTGTDVKDASVGINQQNNQPEVQLKLTADGAKKFAIATQKYQGQVISIYMDQEVASAPTVQSVITNGEAVITGSKSIDEAKRLAGIIKSGSLPVRLTPATVTTIGPSLGAEAIPTSEKAAVIGIGIVMLAMLIYYKVPGLIADIALVAYMLINILLFLALGATLTLPGIAGLLLSVGVAVDANILIFERTKEELRHGKSIKAALEAGYHKASSSIIDSNVTTLIAGAVLYFFGSGTIKGFALTLNLGVICSLFTAFVITRFLLFTFVNAGLITDKKFYTPIIK